jgi:RHS repeat-associated protein
MDKYTGTGSTPYYFHTNEIGSVTAITDENGNLVERLSYDPYGMPTFTDAGGEVVSKSTIGNTLLFHGRRYDAETNLYYFRARYYDPIIGRLLQTDPMGYEDSMNLFQAFNMNPVNFTDSMGLQSVDEINITLFREFRNWELQVREEYNYTEPFRVQWERGRRGRPYVDITTCLGPMRLYNYKLRKLHPYIDERDLLIRGGGLLQAAWGAVQIKMAAAISAASGGALSPLSVALIAMGADNKAAGASKVVTGRHQETLLNKGLQEGAKLISDDPEFQTNFANYGESVLNLITGSVVYNQISQSGRIIEVTGKVDDTLDASKNGQKKVPTPYGKKGGPLHQGKIKEVAKNLRHQGYDIGFEAYIPTPGGFKKSRDADIIVKDPATNKRWLIQIGKQIKKGLPISRELKAIKDLEKVGYIVEFISYN